MGKGVMLKKKGGENIYPVTASDLVYDPITKKNVKDELNELKGVQEEQLSAEQVNVVVIGPTTGFSITIKEVNGNILYTQLNPSESFKIQAGTEYIVEASNNVDKYVAPASQTFVAEEYGVRTINVIYTPHAGTRYPAYGTYLRDKDGFYYTKEEYNSVVNYECVALITPEKKIGISFKYNSYSITPMESYNERLLNAMTTTYNIYNYFKDMDGYKNTQDILSVCPETNGAAGFCNSFSLANGNKGYLNSAGEKTLIRSNSESINELLALVGGGTIQDGWASTCINNNGKPEFPASNGNRLSPDYSDQHIRPCFKLD